ncbi:MAG: hypothetical protein K4571_13110 [Deltaproteobacteria bacterium]
MKRLNWVMACLVVAGLVFSASFICSAADLTGVWNVEVVISGTTGTPVFTLKQEGDKLAGRYKSQYGEFDCVGTVKENDFEIIADVGGNKFTYKGKVDGDKMTGTADLGGQASGPFTGKKAK